MNYIKDTFTRMDLQQIRQFLLQGTENLSYENQTYHDRLTQGSDPIYNRLKEIYPKQAEFDRAASDLSTALTTHENVYMELGMKAEARLVYQLLLTDNPVGTDSKEVIRMPDYQAMYRRLFQSQTQAIEILQQAQLDTEEMYISAPEPDIRVLDLPKPDEDEIE